MPRQFEVIENFSVKVAEVLIDAVESAKRPYIDTKNHQVVGELENFVNTLHNLIERAALIECEQFNKPKTGNEDLL